MISLRPVQRGRCLFDSAILVRIYLAIKCLRDCVRPSSLTTGGDQPALDISITDPLFAGELQEA